MDDAYEMPGTSLEPGEQPSSTVFCLLPGMTGFGRFGRRVDVSHLAGVPGVAQLSPHTGGTRRTGESEGTAP